MQAILDTTDKPKKGGKESKKEVKKAEGLSGATKPSPKKQKSPTASSMAVPKRRKQPARKRKTSTPSKSKESDSETHSIFNEEEISVYNEEAETVQNQEPPVHNEEDTTNRVVHQSIRELVPSPHPSPKSTSIPITIAPCPPPVISSQPTKVPISTPILTASTTNPITSMIPEVSINVSDTGDTTSVFATPVSSSISPIRNDDLEMIFAEDGDEYDLGGFTYNPFQITTENEDETSISKGQLKAIHEKLDQLLLASKASPSDVYLKAMVESLFGRIKEHEENAKKMNASLFESVEVCKSATKGVGSGSWINDLTG
ncbi:unnamed protein product [Lactuca saligna]|uniref:Uncharacterized protein n=1 Tax=Lactuca saligna TaxID=75948 RepID=A0AA35VCF1_LACSI|nr:unnamed protein product [Lactuca saligna]